MTISRIKATARGALHEFMGRPASLYLDPAVEPPAPITARHHEKPKLVGDLAGTSFNYAQSHDDEETIVFLCSQLEPLVGVSGSPPRGALVVFSATEGYFVDNTQPRYGLTVTAGVTPASATELAGKTVP